MTHRNNVELWMLNSKVIAFLPRAMTSTPWQGRGSGARRDSFVEEVQLAKGKGKAKGKTKGKSKDRLYFEDDDETYFLQSKGEPKGKSKGK